MFFSSLWRSLPLFSTWITYVLLTATDAASMEFTIKGEVGGPCSGCILVQATGEITPETPGKFQALLDEYRTPKAGNFVYNQIWLDSPGGDLRAGLELGRLFREYGFNTFTGFPRGENASDTMQCLSACAYAFLGSEFRDGMALGLSAIQLQTNTSLGFHQFTDIPELTSQATPAFTGLDRLKDQIVAGVIIEYLLEMAIHTDLYTAASKAPPNDMYFPTLDEAVSFQIIDGGTAEIAIPQNVALAGESFEDPLSWQIAPYGKGLRLDMAMENRGQRVFCMQNEPGRLHFQILHRTVDGTTVYQSQYGVGDIANAAKYLSSVELHAMEADTEKTRTYPAAFGGIFTDTEGDFTFLLDFVISTSDIANLRPGDMIGFNNPSLEQTFDEKSSASDNASELSILFALAEATTGWIPPTTNPGLLQLIGRNCI